MVMKLILLAAFLIMRGFPHVIQVHSYNKKHCFSFVPCLTNTFWSVLFIPHKVAGNDAGP